MYDSAHAVSTTNPVNGSAGGDLVVDGSGTINPAALNNGMSFLFLFLVFVLVVIFIISCLSHSPLLYPSFSVLPHQLATDKNTPSLPVAPLQN